MNNQTGTVKIHRILKTSPEKNYRAFLEADAISKWLPPYGFTCTVDHLNAKVGGTFKMAFKNFTTGHSHAFGGEYLELKPVEMCYLGWQVSLVQLAVLVEPEIQG